jgi:hypothetical protein
MKSPLLTMCDFNQNIVTVTGLYLLSVYDGESKQKKLLLNK